MAPPLRVTTAASAALAGAIALALALAMQMWPQRCCRIFALQSGSGFGGSHGGLGRGGCRGGGKEEEEEDEVAAAEEESPGLSSLQEEGYVVLRGFLSTSEAARLLALYRALPESRVHAQGSFSGFRDPPRGAVEAAAPGLRGKLTALLDRVRLEAGIPCEVESPDLQALFLHTDARDPQSVMLPWHSDSEAGILHHDQYTYLNFYLVLDKPFSGTAGLAVVPQGLLREHCPELAALLHGTAGKDFEELGPRTMMMYDNLDDGRYLLDFHLDNVSCVPRLASRDLILIRGDLLHRTQPHTQDPSWRTTLSIRVPSTQRFRLSRVLQGGLTRYTFLRHRARQWAEELTLMLLLQRGGCDDGASHTLHHGQHRHPSGAEGAGGGRRPGPARRRSAAPQRGGPAPPWWCGEWPRLALRGALELLIRAGHAYRQLLWRVRSLVAAARGELLVAHRTS